MSSDRQEPFETIGEAASRLLAGLVRRAEKSRPGAESAPQITDAGESPLSAGKRAGEASNNGEDALEPLPQLAGGLGNESHPVSAIRGEVVARRRLVLKADNDNWRDRGALRGFDTPVAGAGRSSALGE